MAAKSTKHRALIIVLSSFIAVLVILFGVTKIVNRHSNDLTSDFYQAVENGLTSGSFTRTSVQTSKGNVQTTLTHVNLNSKPKILESTQSTTPNQKDILSKIEKIADLDNVYIRFLNISSPDQKKLIELSESQKAAWGKKAEQPFPVEVPNSLYSVIPRGKLNKTDADTVIRTMQDNGTYNIKEETVKRETVDGKESLVVEVEVQPVNLAKSLIVYDSILGYQKDSKADPNNLARNPVRKLKVTINSSDYSITRIDYLDSNSYEILEPYKGPDTINTPANAVELEELATSYMKLVQ